MDCSHCVDDNIVATAMTRLRDAALAQPTQTDRAVRVIPAQRRVEDRTRRRDATRVTLRPRETPHRRRKSEA
jgi:hypothetical protein